MSKTAGAVAMLFDPSVLTLGEYLTEKRSHFPIPTGTVLHLHEWEVVWELEYLRAKELHSKLKQCGQSSIKFVAPSAACDLSVAAKREKTKFDDLSEHSRKNYTGGFFHVDHNSEAE